MNYILLIVLDFFFTENVARSIYHKNLAQCFSTNVDKYSYLSYEIIELFSIILQGFGNNFGIIIYLRD